MVVVVVDVGDGDGDDVVDDDENGRWTKDIDVLPKDSAVGARWEINKHQRATFRLTVPVVVVMVEAGVGMAAVVQTV